MIHFMVSSELDKSSIETPPIPSNKRDNVVFPLPFQPYIRLNCLKVGRSESHV